MAGELLYRYKTDATARRADRSINANDRASRLRSGTEAVEKHGSRRNILCGHRQRQCFGELVELMQSGPVVVQISQERCDRTNISRLHGGDRSGQGGPRHHPQKFTPAIGENSVPRLGCAGYRSPGASPSYYPATISFCFLSPDPPPTLGQPVGSHCLGCGFHQDEVRKG